jgi:transmembrane sensor
MSSSDQDHETTTSALKESMRSPPVDNARLARQWDVISSRVGPSSTLSRAASRWPVFLVAAVAAALLVIVIARPWQAKQQPMASTSATPMPSAVAKKVITLSDGSQVTLDSDAALTIDRADAENIHLVLASGGIDVDVTHRESRTSFVVSAGGHDVSVIGTQFRVEASASALTVEVRRGLVRVDGPTKTPRLLGAGEKWTTTATATAPTPPSSVLSLDEPPAPSARTPVAPSTTSVPSPSARDLLARATEARAAGRPRDAAVLLDKIRSQHRGDARAGLAAFELGRVRIDALGDPAGAAEAFADAIALSPRATFREDAEARRIEALEASGQRAACEQAKASYLERYPSGLYNRQVSQRCAARGR